MLRPAMPCWFPCWMTASPWRADHDQKGKALHERPIQIPMATWIHRKHVNSVLAIFWHENPVCFQEFPRKLAKVDFRHMDAAKEKYPGRKNVAKGMMKENRELNKNCEGFRGCPCETGIFGQVPFLVIEIVQPFCGRMSWRLKTLERQGNFMLHGRKKYHLCVLLLKVSLVQRWLCGNRAETTWFRNQIL